MHFVGENNLEKVLVSETGLIRGYVVPSSQCKRTSPLLLEDFVDQLGNGNFEQFGRSGERDKSSFFSKTTFGDTKYQSYGSVSIEQLQFISLDKKFDRAAMVIKEGQGEKIAQQIISFLSSIVNDYSIKSNTTLQPNATFHQNYIRQGTIFKEGEAGILLNQDAITILVQLTLSLIRELSIRQAKGYMLVDEILIDYNNSHKMMRIKHYEDEISKAPDKNYAIYYEKNSG